MGKSLIYAVQIVIVSLIVVTLLKCKCGCWSSIFYKCDCCCSTGDCCGSDVNSGESFTPSSTIPPNSHRMVTLYYTNWCGYCKIMRPVWDQVRAATAGSGIVYREIDNDIEKAAGITGVPTIMMLDETGHAYKYAGGANYAELRNWIVSPLMQGNR